MGKEKRFLKKKFVVVFIVIFICILSVLIAAKGIVSNMQANLEQMADLEIQNVDLTKIPDGTYAGSCKVFPISVKVDVTINNYKITRIELVEHRNGQGTPAEIIPDKVVKAQSLEVDIVTGATYSSKAILKAIENALNSSSK